MKSGKDVEKKRGKLSGRLTWFDKLYIGIAIVIIAVLVADYLFFHPPLPPRNYVDFDHEVTGISYQHPQFNVTVVIKEDIPIMLNSYKVLYQSQEIVGTKPLPPFLMREDEIIHFQFDLGTHEKLPNGETLNIFLILADESHWKIEVEVPESVLTSLTEDMNITCEWQITEVTIYKETEQGYFSFWTLDGDN